LAPPALKYFFSNHQVIMQSQVRLFSLSNRFLNFPSRSFSHLRHSSMAFSLSSGELAG
jgi:hypothetical protein